MTRNTGDNDNDIVHKIIYTYNARLKIPVYYQYALVVPLKKFKKIYIFIYLFIYLFRLASELDRR